MNINIYILLCVLLVFFDGTAVSRAENADEKSIVEGRYLHREYRFFALVDYRSQYKIYALEAGKLDAHNLYVNRIYQSGEILLTLKNDTVYQELLQRKAQLIEARQALRRAELGIRHGQAAQVELEKTREQMTIAQASHSIAQEAFASLKVTAPFQGRLLRFAPKLHASEEQNLTVIEKGDLLAELVRDEPYILKGTVVLPQGAPDMEECRVLIEENGNWEEARLITWRQAGEVNGGEIRTLVLEPPPSLRDASPGTTASAVLRLPSRFAARTVPRSFVLHKGDMRYCLVERRGEQREVSVMTGEYDASHVEVFGGLNPGDTVLRPGVW